MSFDDWLDQAWNDHAEQAAAVAARLHEGAALAADENQLSQLAHLAHHVLGEHLAQWSSARCFVQALQPRAAPGAATAQALARYLAALDLAEGREETADRLGASDRIRARALAAASLAPHDTPRAMQLFRQALAAADAGGLLGTDPCVRSLAVSGNNLACALEERPPRNEAERELMLLAAQAARRCWALAGGWLETERAEYRLACSWRVASDAARAREHAQRCLQIVHAHGDVALERFFGWEALGLAEAAAGRAAEHAQALAQARAAFAALDDGDRGACRASLDALAAAAPG